MTRNEWIAETAAKLVCVPLKPGFSNHTSDEALMVSVELADALEAANVAPWTAPAPALTDTAAKVVEAAEELLPWLDAVRVNELRPRALGDAVRAHLAAKQGGAK